MIYVLAILALLAAIVLLQRVRLQFEMSPHVKQLITKIGPMKFRLIGAAGKPTQAVLVAKRESTKVRPAQIAELFKYLPSAARAVLSFLRGIIRDTTIDELYGEVKAGFDSPDLTGQAVGWYHAVTGAIPGATAHFRFIPDWNGASMSGHASVTVSVPVYKLVYRLVLLIARLPLRGIVKTIRKIKNTGGDDAE